MDFSVFHTIANQNLWGSKESLSGPGSTLDSTVSLRSALPGILLDLGIRTLVDAPCGDMNWMRHLQYSFEKFIGVDIVPSVIEMLRKQAFPVSHHFQVGNIATDILPAADAVLCRDCLVHLPFSAIQAAARLWKLAGFKYVLATTFPDKMSNEDIAPGGWRPLNMRAAPFLWSEPVMLLIDNDGVGAPDDDKSLGVWRL